MTGRDSHSPAWNAFTCLSFAAAVTMAVLGICYLPLGIWERGYMGIAALFLVHSSISLTKTLGDRYEADVAEPGR